MQDAVLLPSEPNAAHLFVKRVPVKPQSPRLDWAMRIRHIRLPVRVVPQVAVSNDDEARLLTEARTSHKSTQCASNALHPHMNTSPLR